MNELNLEWRLNGTLSAWVTRINIVVFLVSLFFVSLLLILCAPSIAHAEIRLTPPANWESDPSNNATIKTWHQNSTKSSFSVNKVPDNFVFPLYLLGPAVARFFENTGVLETQDTTIFGQDYYFGYRYFLNFSSPSKIFSSTAKQNFLPNEPKMEVPEGNDVPFKGMMILSEQQKNLYMILIMSPRGNFDSVLRQLNPTLDSIQLTNPTISGF